MSPGDDPSGTAQVQAKSTRSHCAVLVAVVVIEVIAPSIVSARAVPALTSATQATTRQAARAASHRPAPGSLMRVAGLSRRPIQHRPPSSARPLRPPGPLVTSVDVRHVPTPNSSSFVKGRPHAAPLDEDAPPPGS